MRHFVATRALVAASVCLVASTAFGWGFDGHRRLASMVHTPLPSGSCLRQWLQSHAQTAGYQNSALDPDRWRLTSQSAYDPNEAPRHYLEIDWVQPATDYPREWAAAQERLGEKYATNNGKVPWRVEELYGTLVEAFRAGDAAKAALTSAHLSHYVTDSFSVLHNTKNFDPAGLHSRWESDMLNVRAYLDGIAALSAQYVGTVGKADPRHNTFDVVLVGNGLVDALIKADQESTPGDGGAFDMPRFYGSVKDLTARRWGDALTVFASLVATAWVEAGRPALPNTQAGCSTVVSSAEIMLAGFPVPGGFTHPRSGEADAGTDAGEPDPGFPGIDDAGTWQQPDAGVQHVLPDEVPAGCGGCGGTSGVMAWPLGALALFLVAARRRARGQV